MVDSPGTELRAAVTDHPPGATGPDAATPPSAGATTGPALSKLSQAFVGLHAVAWFAAAFPPQLSLRATAGAWIGTFAAGAIAASAPRELPPSARVPTLVYAAASALAATVIAAAPVVGAPDATVLASAAGLLLVGLHLAALAGLHGRPEALLTHLSQRPFHRSPDEPWPSVLRRVLIADAGFLVGGIFTGVATLGGSFLTAGIAVLGWIVGAGGLGAAAIDGLIALPGLARHDPDADVEAGSDAGPPGAARQ